MVSDAETVDTNFVRGLRQPSSDVAIKSLIGLNKVSNNDKTHYVLVNRLQRCLLFCFITRHIREQNLLKINHIKNNTKEKNQRGIYRALTQRMG